MPRCRIICHLGTFQGHTWRYLGDPEETGIGLASLCLKARPDKSLWLTEITFALGGVSVGIDFCCPIMSQHDPNKQVTGLEAEVKLFKFCFCPQLLL